jgi:hypothetical protein
MPAEMAFRSSRRRILLVLNRRDISALKSALRSRGFLASASSAKSVGPLGAHQKIETDLLDSLQRKWAKDGDSIVDKAAIQDPVAFLNVIAKVLPKELAISVEQRTPGGLTPEAYATLRRLLDIIERRSAFSATRTASNCKFTSLYDLEGDETNDPAAARRILVSRLDGKFVVIEVGAGTAGGLGITFDAISDETLRISYLAIINLDPGGLFGDRCPNTLKRGSRQNVARILKQRC